MQQFLTHVNGNGRPSVENPYNHQMESDVAYSSGSMAGEMGVNTLQNAVPSE